MSAKLLSFESAEFASRVSFGLSLEQCFVRPLHAYSCFDIKMSVLFTISCLGLILVKSVYETDCDKRSMQKSLKCGTNEINEIKQYQCSTCIDSLQLSKCLSLSDLNNGYISEISIINSTICKYKEEKCTITYQCSNELDTMSTDLPITTSITSMCW